MKQPTGAAVRLESPAKAGCKVTHITVPGNHMFSFEVSDGTNTVSQELTVPVYPPNTAPTIAAIQATPAVVTTREESTLLSATTSDPDGDVISHWWRIKRRPRGSKPVFAKQGARDTKVTGLTVEGSYVFELTVVDRTKSARKNVFVTVAAKPKGNQE